MRTPVEELKRGDRVRWNKMPFVVLGVRTHTLHPFMYEVAFDTPGFTCMYVEYPQGTIFEVEE